MERFFNTAGPLNPNEHYILDPLSRWDLSEVLTLIHQKKYFLLHAPRQTGKTTCLKALRDHLNEAGSYRCVYVNVEAGQAARNDIEAAMAAIFRELALEAQDQLQDQWPEEHWRTILQQDKALSALGSLLRGWCLHNPKPLVLLIDEIDSLLGLSLISVLRQLRLGYPKRPDRFPNSIVLCGLRHLRDYRMELGEEGEYLVKGGSPFNIHSESLRLGGFSLRDIQTLYAQHTQETDQRFEEGVCKRVFELTRGQPWLVNALAYDVCFRNKAGQDRSKVITVSDMEAAKERLIQRRETHLDQLMAKLKQERVHRVIEPMLLGIEQPMSPQDVEYVQDLGLIHCELNGEMRIANPIYHEVIPRQLSYKHQLGIQRRQADYVTATTGKLHVKKLLQTFQQFFRENADSWLEGFQYKEAGPHLILQAFLQRIINGGGSIHREYALGRGRTDLLITWPHHAAVATQAAQKVAIDSLSSRPSTQCQQSPLGPQQRRAHYQRAQHQRIVLELKLLRQKDGFDKKRAEGLEQTAEYMDGCGATEGHLLLFDRRPGKSWDERIWVKPEKSSDGKKITLWGL
ncbi:MAG: ATP-binding protein [Myxococcota bacterium]